MEAVDQRRRMERKQFGTINCNSIRLSGERGGRVKPLVQSRLLSMARNPGRYGAWRAQDLCTLIYPSMHRDYCHPPV